MMIRPEHITRLLALCALILTGCATERISNQNLSFLYDKGASVLHPEVALRHLNDSVTRLEFRIESKELLYTQNPVTNFWSAEFKIRYEIQDQTDAKLMSDSAMIIFRDSSLMVPEKKIRGYLDLKPSRVATQTMLLDITDTRRGSRDRGIYSIDRSNLNSRQHFFAQAEGERDMLFRNHIRANENVIVRHSDIRLTKAKVLYFGRSFPLPPPPFSVEPNKPFEFRPDTVFEVNLGYPLQLKGNGLYLFQVDDSLRNGFALHRFEDGFPEVKTVKALVEPMRYINSGQEYRHISEAERPKVEVDEFWVKIAGSTDRARGLISRYYGRVQEANEFFTSYLEGWKTDRGLVYIIFGPPNTLYKNHDSEYWVYGDEGSLTSLGFTFLRLDNPFSDNDYRLDRSPIYKNSWYQGVDSWRQGRVYSDR
jgi:GWxTD domain-containing protein